MTLDLALRVRDILAGGRLRDGSHPRPRRLPAARGAHGACEHRSRRPLPVAALQRERRRQSPRRRDLFSQPRLERALDADGRPREQHGGRQHERPAADRPGNPELEDGRVEPVRRTRPALPVRHAAPQASRRQESRRQAGAFLRAHRRADAQHPRRGLLHQPPDGGPAPGRPGLPPADRPGARRRRETLRRDREDRRPGRRRGERPDEPPPPDRAHAQHRHHRAHRRRQDHGQRALPLLLRPQPQDRRGPRRRRDDGLDAPGAGARDHDHRGGHDLRLARAPGQPDRHARARRLHDRGRTLAARSRRRRGRLLRGRRCAAADRDRLAPGGALARADDLFRQQARPHRRRLRRRRRRNRRAARFAAGAAAAADRHREGVPGRDRPAPDAGAALGRRRPRRGVRDRRHPRRAGRRGRRRPRPAGGDGGRTRRGAARGLPRECRPVGRRDSRRAAAPDDRPHGDPGALRQRPAQQGCPAAARRGRRSAPLPGRHAADRGHQPEIRGDASAANRGSARRCAPWPSKS